MLGSKEDKLKAWKEQKMKRKNRAVWTTSHKETAKARYSWSLLRFDVGHREMISVSSPRENRFRPEIFLEISPNYFATTHCRNSFTFNYNRIIYTVTLNGNRIWSVELLGAQTSEQRGIGNDWPISTKWYTLLGRTQPRPLKVSSSFLIWDL